MSIKNLSVVTFPYNLILPDGTPAMDMTHEELGKILDGSYGWEIEGTWHNEEAEKLIVLLVQRT